MNATLRKRLLKWTSIIALGILFVADARPALAMPCFTDLSNCYLRAALVDGIWMRFAAGMDCELTFASCLREDLAGW
jgi:hypothetical protein